MIEDPAVEEFLARVEASAEIRDAADGFSVSAREVALRLTDDWVRLLDDDPGVALVITVAASVLGHDWLYSTVLEAMKKTGPPTNGTKR